MGVAVGDLLEIADARGARRVRVVLIGLPFGEIAVRNALTNRLSYVKLRDPRVRVVESVGQPPDIGADVPGGGAV